MPGDILYSREGERFGIAACVPDGRRLCISHRMMVFRVRPECNPARVVLTTDGDALVCTCLDRPTAERLARDQAAGPSLEDRIDATHFRVRPALRGVLKQALVAAGFPAEDLAG
jgi:hypothetical protein